MPVYFVQAGEGGAVKIGWSSNVKVRIASLQTAHYEKLSLIRTIDSGKETEQALHRRFQHQRIRNEWFRFDPDMLSASLTSTLDCQVIPIPVVRREGMTQAEYLILRFGGASQLARTLKLIPSVIQGWKDRGRVPATRGPEIIEAGQSLSPRLEPLELFEQRDGTRHSFGRGHSARSQAA